jgi:hypothetical protein
MKIDHPQKICIPVETAMATWGGVGHWEVKLDGVFAVRAVAGGILVGENIRGNFTAFDCVERNGADIRSLPLSVRLHHRNTLAIFHSIPIVPSTNQDGASFLKLALNTGCEGVVKKDLTASYYAPMVACKRSQIHVCTVTAIGPGQSIALADASTGQARGKCPAKGGAADVLRVGDRVRVECDSIHDSGLFRSAKLCRQYKISGP